MQLDVQWGGCYTLIVCCVLGTVQNIWFCTMFGIPGGAMVKNLPASAGDARTRVLSLCWEDPLEYEMAAPSSILAWRIPWTEEPGELQAIVWQRVRHDWACTSTYVWCFREAACDVLSFVRLRVTCSHTLAQIYYGKVQMSLPHLLWTFREMEPTACAYLVFCGSRPSSQRVISPWILTPLCDRRRGSQHDKCPVGHVSKFPNCRFQSQSWHFFQVFFFFDVNHF